MKREDFINVAEETLDSLPDEFRGRIQNVAILVEDFPANQRPPKLGQRRRLLLGIFHGVPATKSSVFNLPTGPEHIVLYQKNIEAVCSNEAEVRHQIRQTLIHELGHYFGMTEEQLRMCSCNGIGHWITHSPITPPDSSAASRFANVRQLEG